MAHKRQLARCEPSVAPEWIHERRRVRASAGNAANSSEISRGLEENDSIDEVYRSLLLSLLTVDDKIEHRRKSSALKKRKPNIDIMEQEADCYVEEQIDPDYEFILRQLKDLDKSSALKFKKGIVPLSHAIKYKAVVPLSHAIKYKADTGDDGDGIVRIDKEQFHQYVAGSRLKRVHPAQTGDKNKARHLVQFDHRPTVGNNNLVLNQSEYRGQAPISEKNKVHGVRKEFGVIKQMKLIQKEKQPDRINGIQIDREYLNQKSGLSKRGRECAPVHVNKALPGCLQRLAKGKKAVVEDVRLDDGLSSKKTAFGNSAVKKEPYHSVKTHRPLKGIHCQITNAKSTRCSIPFKKSDGKCFKGESSSKTVPAEVEILDNDMVVKKRMFGHFVPSMKFHSSMMDEKPEEYGRPMASEDFRTEVLKVLRKPYNKEEYRKCREQIRVGSYTIYHPDLQTKLTRFRYKRDKCLIVVRGFLFWLQNLTREGAFEPWKDRECLAVELPSC